MNSQEGPTKIISYICDGCKFHKQDQRSFPGPGEQAWKSYWFNHCTFSLDSFRLIEDNSFHPITPSWCSLKEKEE